VHEGTEIAVEVRDDGEGIAQEHLPHVFERFYIADKSRTGKGHGAGLGLAIAHQIVVAHGRALTVMSGASVGGTVFRFSLPAAVADDS
jgi:signal transduction histidine kinase